MGRPESADWTDWKIFQIEGHQTQSAKCLRCDWTTALNRTRMNKHREHNCQDAPRNPRQHPEGEASLVEESATPQVPGWAVFQVIGRKGKSARCQRCGWTTSMNRTRMNQHRENDCQNAVERQRELQEAQNPNERSFGGAPKAEPSPVMAGSQATSNDFLSRVDAVAAPWLSGQQTSPQRSQPSRPVDRGRLTPSSTGQTASSQPLPNQTQGTSASTPAPASAPTVVNIGSDITAWQTAIQTLPDDFKNQPYPTHPLPVALASQPTVRQIEWNPYRQTGGFVPRTAHDFASMLIFISGQINPNPCRNCLLKNGPFARCVVSPPEVLAISTLRHACANCTYQNQYKRCNNNPLTQDEITRSMWAKQRPNHAPRVGPLVPRKPKLKAPRKHRLDAAGTSASKRYKPTSLGVSTTPSLSLEAFADKLRQARSWSPRAMQRMKAELLQWQAAIATVEAEKLESPPLTSTHVAPAPRTAQRPSIPYTSRPQGLGAQRQATVQTFYPRPVTLSTEPEDGEDTDVTESEQEGMEEQEEHEDENMTDDVEGDTGGTWGGLDGDSAVHIKVPH